MKYVGKCPNCDSQITVEFEVTKSKPNLTKNDVWIGSEPYVFDAIKNSCKTNKEIGEYVAKNFPGWRWKSKYTLIGFALSKLVKEKKLVRKPLLVEKNGYSHWISSYELPEQDLRHMASVLETTQQ